MGFLDAVGLGLQVGGSLLGLFGESEEAEANEEALKYRASIARRNAQIARESASEALRRGEFDANDAIEQGIQAEAAKRAQVRQLIGSQRVALAGSGVMVDGGTATDIQRDTAQLGEIDALTIRNRAERTERALRLASQDTASSFEQRALQEEANAQLFEMGAENAATSGALNVGASLLSSAGRVASSWYQYNQSGGSFFGG